MSCTCSKPQRTGLWTPIPEFRSPTEILPGENIECYAKRAGTQGKNDIAETIENKIDNTSLATDTNATVNEQLILTPNSTKTASRWKMLVDGVELTSSNNLLGSGVSFNTGTGKFAGAVPSDKQNKTYKLLITAYDSSNIEIDSREFSFIPKKSSPQDTVKFVFPYSSNGRVTCRFGPRKPPAAGASSMHKGVDISAPGPGLGEILSAGDGTVVKCGPASGFGNWVVIEHKDGSGKLVATTVYGHMSQIYVTVGQKVAAGQKIAKEGNAGIGSAAHLHFEIHKGSWGNPVDPLPYLNGTFDVAQNNIPGKYGEPDPATFKPVSNNKRGMSSAEVESADTCPLVLKNQSTTPGDISVTPESNITASGGGDVISEIKRALDEDASLSADDKKYILFIAKIESNYNPAAKNSSTSALGLYQMVDATANYAFKKIGVTPSYENRTNPYLATKAQIFYYKKDQLALYTEFKSSGTIAGKGIDATISSRYAAYNKGEFTYVLHHDGVGNMVRGKDMQGLDYYRKKIATA